jgi:Fic family protein
MIERALSGELDQDKKSRDLQLEAIAHVRGEYDRGEAARITGLPERSARRVLNDVVAEGLLASATQKGPVSLRFPTDSLEIFFPRLYVQA